MLNALHLRFINLELGGVRLQCLSDEKQAHVCKACSDGDANGIAFAAGALYSVLIVTMTCACVGWDSTPSKSNQCTIVRYSWRCLGAHLTMSSTRRIISAASVADSSTCCFTCGTATALTCPCSSKNYDTARCSKSYSSRHLLLCVYIHACSVQHSFEQHLQENTFCKCMLRTVLSTLSQGKAGFLRRFRLPLHVLTRKDS